VSGQVATATATAQPRFYGWSALVAGVRGVWRGWRVVLPVVVGNALVQALLVLPDPIPGQSAYAGVLAALSFLVLLLGAALLAASALESVHGPVRWAPAGARSRRSLGWFAVWFVGWVVVLAVGLALWTWPGLLWLALTPYLLLAASDGRRAGAATTDLRAILARPVRWLVTTIVVGVVAAIAWLLAAVTGFFVGGALGSAVTWFWYGLLAAWFLAAWAAVYRSTPVGTPHG
jgi:hypothetical protein